MYFVYVLENGNGKWYIGQTDNLQTRLLKHNQNLVISTKNHGPWKIFYTESYDTRSKAMKRERFLKSGRGRILLKNVLKNEQHLSSPVAQR